MRKCLSCNNMAYGDARYCSRECVVRTGGGKKYGAVATREMPLYGVWIEMRRRCAKHPRYLKRNIAVCKRWQESFENFAADVGGDYTKGMTLDRIDNDGGYSPGNVRWATYSQQANNRGNNKRISFEGKTQTVQQWADELGMRRDTLAWRLNNGWSVQKALTIKVALRKS